jgi:hypothetical protein
MRNLRNLSLGSKTLVSELSSIDHTRIELSGINKTKCKTESILIYGNDLNKKKNVF